MKITAILMIDADKEENVTAKAFSTESANIYITAGNMDKAQALLITGRQQAEEAMLSWTPEQEEAAPAPAEQKPQKHYVLYTGKTIEDMNEEASAYEDTPAGQRFIKRIDNARAFYFKHSKGGLLVSEMNYLANIHRNSLVNGRLDLIALFYKRGFTDGKAALEKRRREKEKC